MQKDKKSIQLDITAMKQPKPYMLKEAILVYTLFAIPLLIIIFNM